MIFHEKYDMITYILWSIFAFIRSVLESLFIPILDLINTQDPIVLHNYGSNRNLKYDK